MISKDEILKYCIDSVNKRIEEIDWAIKDADAALADDTKSSAGDKYETSREMVQQDINRYQSQLKVANQDLLVLQKIDLLQSKSIVSLGTLVETNVGLYFISISIGMIKLNNTNVFVISPISPIGKILMGKEKGDKIVFNNNAQEIISIS